MEHLNCCENFLFFYSRVEQLEIRSTSFHEKKKILSWWIVRKMLLKVIIVILCGNVSVTRSNRLRRSELTCLLILREISISFENSRRANPKKNFSSWRRGYSEKKYFISILGEVSIIFNSSKNNGERSENGYGNFRKFLCNVTEFYLPSIIRF